MSGFLARNKIKILFGTAISASFGGLAIYYYSNLESEQIFLIRNELKESENEIAEEKPLKKVSFPFLPVRGESVGCNRVYYYKVSPYESLRYEMYVKDWEKGLFLTTVVDLHNKKINYILSPRVFSRELGKWIIDGDGSEIKASGVPLSVDSQQLLNQIKSWNISDLQSSEFQSHFTNQVEDTQKISGSFDILNTLNPFSDSSNVITNAKQWYLPFKNIKGAIEKADVNRCNGFFNSNK